MSKAVLHFIWSAGFGGIGKLVYDLSTRQTQNEDLEVGILFGKQEGQLLAQFQEIGISCQFAGFKHGLDFSLDKYKRLLDIYRAYDILHFHNFNPFIALTAVVSSKPIVYTEHGNFGFGRKRKLHEWMYKALLKKRFLNKYVQSISFNSQFTRRYAEQQFGLSNVAGKVIYNGIDFSTRDCTGNSEVPLLKETQDKFVVGTTSRFAGFKRVNLLIDAFAAFQQNKETVLVLVGDGTLREELEMQVDRLGISDKTIFTGYRRNVVGFQKLMDVCVFPSENEPFGLVAVETLALGKPTIVFEDGGGIIEVVGGISREDTVRDRSQLTERLNYYYHNREQTEAGASVRRECAKKFSIERMEKQMADVYQEVA